MTPSPGIEPGPHWWEASALTSTPSLHPNNTTVMLNSKAKSTQPFQLRGGGGGKGGVGGKVEGEGVPIIQQIRTFDSSSMNAIVDENIKHEEECFIGFQNTEKWVEKNAVRNS